MCDSMPVVIEVVLFVLGVLGVVMLLSGIRWSYLNNKLLEENTRLRTTHRPACLRCGAQEILIVHHRNGDPYDNSPANLELWCAACLKTLPSKAQVHDG